MNNKLELCLINARNIFKIYDHFDAFYNPIYFFMLRMSYRHCLFLLRISWRLRPVAKRVELYFFILLFSFYDIPLSFGDSLYIESIASSGTPLF